MNDNANCFFFAVCLDWRDLFDYLFKLTRLDIIMSDPAPSPIEKRLNLSDIKKLIMSGSIHYLKTFRVIVRQKKPWVRVIVNDSEQFLIAEEGLDLPGFIEEAASIPTPNVETVYFDIDDCSSGEKLSMVKSMAKLVDSNRNLRNFTLILEETPISSTDLQLQDLPQSIRNFEMLFFVEDASTLHDVSKIFFFHKQEKLRLILCCSGYYRAKKLASVA